MRVEVQSLHGGTELRVVVVDQLLVVLGAERLVGTGDDEVEQVDDWTACLQSLKVQDLDFYLAVLTKNAVKIQFNASRDQRAGLFKELALPSNVAMLPAF